MSDWKDLLEPEPDLISIPDVDADPFGVSVEIVEIGEWRFDGPEPPPHVVRLKPVEPPDGWEGDDDLGGGRLTELARVPLSDDGAPRGWWWTKRGTQAFTEKGWEWGRAPKARSQLVLRQHFPVTSDPNGPFCRSLVLALPPDEVWYQVAVDQRGIPVWGCSFGDGEWDTTVSTEHPEGD